MHEAAHRNRHHFQCLIFMRLLCAVYWFHPMVWLMLHYLREDMEVRCDYCAVQATEKNESAYVGAMLDFARIQAAMYQTEKRGIEMPFLNKNGKLKKRVKEIFSFGSYRRTYSVLTAIENRDVDTILACIHDRSEELTGLPRGTAPRLAGNLTYISCEYRAGKASRNQEKNEAKRFDPPVDTRKIIYMIATFSVTATENGTNGFNQGLNTYGLWLMRDDADSEWMVLEFGG